MRHTSPLAQLCNQSASVARKPLLVVTFTTSFERSPAFAFTNISKWYCLDGIPFDQMGLAQDQIPGFTVIYASTYDLQSRTASFHG
jgi:hypothetical protein